MPRALAEDIARGRQAITFAHQRGLDTNEWEESLARLERQQLLAWASEMAEQCLTLPERIVFVEAPLRTITTERVFFLCHPLPVEYHVCEAPGAHRWYGSVQARLVEGAGRRRRWVPW